VDSISQLDIQGYQGLPLANTFFQHSMQTKRLAVLFPGRGYTCAMPVLYYPGRWLYTRDANLLTMEYGFTRKQQILSKLNEEELLLWLTADASAALQAALETGTYQEVVLVGKSLGTLVLSQLAHTPPAGPTNLSFVWLTPLFKNPILYEAVLRNRPRSLCVQGDADPLYDAAAFERARAACAAQALIIPGADHSLEFAGNLDAALDAVRRLLTALAVFTGWG
jgi:hypothetical protein